MTKKNKIPSFLEMFNKIKETSEYKDRMKYWNGIKYLHKIKQIHLNFSSQHLCFVSKENDYLGQHQYATYYTEVENKDKSVNTMISFYNYLFPNVKKSKN